MIFEIPDLEVLRDILAREWSGSYVAIPHSSNQHLFILWIPVTRDVVLSQEPEDTGHYLFTPSCPCDYVTILSANTPANLTIRYEAGIEDDFQIRILSSASCYFVRYLEDIASVVPFWMMWQVADKTDFFRKIQEEHNQ